MAAPTPETLPAPPAPYAAIAAAFDELAKERPVPRRPARGYHRLIEAVHRSIVRPGASVLEIGSGGGDLLAAVEPAEGLGIDFSPAMIAQARHRHPGLTFLLGDAHHLPGTRPFDFVILSDVINDLWDIGEYDYNYTSLT